MTGAKMRTKQATVCARPLTAPRVDLVGAELLKNMNKQPGREKELD